MPNAWSDLGFPATPVVAWVIVRPFVDRPFLEAGSTAMPPASWTEPTWRSGAPTTSSGNPSPSKSYGAATCTAEDAGGASSRSGVASATLSTAANGR